MGGRGPEYADHLNDTEQATLDRLLARVGAPPGQPRPPMNGPEWVPSRRRSVRTAFAAAIATAAVVLAMASAVVAVRTWPSIPSIPSILNTPSSPAAAQARSLPAVWAALAAAAGQSSTPFARKAVLSRDTIELMASGTLEQCFVTALSVQTVVAGDVPWPLKLPGKVTVATLDTPTGMAGLAGCGMVTPTPRLAPHGQLVNESSADLSERWAGLDVYLPPDLLLPSFVDPRVVDARLAIVDIAPTGEDIRLRFDQLLAGYRASVGQSLRAARWWRLWVELVSSPETDPAQRAAAIAAAALRGELGPEALRAEMTGDVTGRPGVTVRVPYETDGAETTADLTFDVDTGMLLQRVIRHAAGPKVRVNVTVYLVLARTGTTS